MRVLVACEFSGIVRQAFRNKGHDAWSADLLDSEDNSKFHLKMDIREMRSKDWDMIIAFPPCTHLAVSGARWFKDKEKEQKESIDFFMTIACSDYPKICIENPIGIMSTKWRKPDQIIQPWQFGHTYQKSTCLWLKNLPLLKPTNIVGKGKFHTTKSGKVLPSWYNIPPSKNRWKERSRTFSGIAEAMAAQWG